MKILVCFKYIPFESEILVNDDRTLNTAAASWIISPYDTNAIEAGMQLAASVENCSVELLTTGSEVIDNSKLRKAVLSRGPAKMYGVRCTSCGDLYSTAVLLKQAIERIKADLVIFGDGSGDMYSQVLGSMLGALLDVPTANAVSSIEAADGGIVVKRNTALCAETLYIKTPAVISVTSDICRARIPSMKDILGAGKKPVEIWDADEFTIEESGTCVSSVLAPPCSQRLGERFKDSDEDIERFAQAIRKCL